MSIYDFSKPPTSMTPVSSLTGMTLPEPPPPEPTPLAVEPPPLAERPDMISLMPDGASMPVVEGSPESKVPVMPRIITPDRQTPAQRIEQVRQACLVELGALLQKYGCRLKGHLVVTNHDGSQVEIENAGDLKVVVRLAFDR